MDVQARLEGARGSQWDGGNQDKNWLAHQVSNSECEEVFLNTPLVVAADEAHSRREARFYALGRTEAGRRLFVVFTMRGDLIRVISARDMSQKERRVYATHEQEEENA